ncbi:MAG: hypothetical protein RRZ24_00170 [Clostridia bacterium]
MPQATGAIISKVFSFVGVPWRSGLKFARKCVAVTAGSPLPPNRFPVEASAPPAATGGYGRYLVV